MEETDETDETNESGRFFHKFFHGRMEKIRFPLALVLARTYLEPAQTKKEGAPSAKPGAPVRLYAALFLLRQRRRRLQRSYPITKTSLKVFSDKPNLLSDSARVRRD